MTITTSLTVKHFLQTAFPGDVEYIDDRLAEKSGNDFLHARVLSVIRSWFEDHASEWHVLCPRGGRVQVSASRIRLPDVVLVPASPAGPEIFGPALVVVEVLSDEDNYMDMQDRIEDYLRAEIANVWLFDSRQWVMRIVQKDGSSKITRRAEDVGSGIYIDLAELDQEMTCIYHLGN